MSHQFKTVDEYVASFPEEVRKVLQVLRKTLKEAAPEAEERISYNIPALRLNGSYLIYFAGWKKHTSLYPYNSAMEAHFKESTDYQTSGKGTIRFPLDQPLPLPFIRKIIEFRVKESFKEKK